MERLESRRLLSGVASLNSIGSAVLSAGPSDIVSVAAPASSPNAPPTVAIAAGNNVSGAVSVVGTDSTTQGNWQGAYGSEGYSIESLTPSLPAGDTASFSGNSLYTWASSTTDTRAPQNPGGGRIASCWYSSGSFTVDLNLADGRAHLLSLYALDWDTTSRSERIDILDSTGATVLATQTVSNFNGGKYVTFQVSGHIQIRITNLGGINAVLSGIFLDPPAVTTASTNLSVLGADDGGESNLTYTWSTTGTPPAGVTFSANGTNAAKNSTATFTEPGTYSLLATITDSGGLSTTSSATVNVVSTLTSIVVTPATTSLNTNSNQQFSAAGYDQFGTAMASQTSFTWSASAGTVDSTGLFTSSGTPGSVTVTAANGSVSGSATVTVNDAAPTVAVGITNAINTGVTFDGTDTTTGGTWQGAYGSQGSNIATLTPALQPGTSMTVSGASLYTWAGSTSDTRAPQNPAGGRIASCWYSGGNFTIDLNLGAGGVHKVSLYVVDWDSLARVEKLDVLDATGTTVLATQTLSNFSNGQYVSFDLTGHVQIRITNLGPVNAVVSGLFIDNSAITYPPPAAVNGTTTNLALLGADDGGESNLSYTWSTTGTPPAAVSFGTNGTNGAKNTVATFTTAGVYSLLATITDAFGLSTTTSATVTVNQTLTSVVVTPASASVRIDGTQQLSATGYDQFGNAMTSQPAFTWAVTAGGGSVDSSGLYTAPSSTGSATVQATSGGLSGTATIVTSPNAAPTVATAAAATPSPVNGATTTLSVLGADDGGESNLTYTWSTSGTPPATVAFSANGSNAAKTTTATFTQAGVYSLLATITDAQGLSTTSGITVTVSQTLTSITVTPGTASLNEDATQGFTAIGYDQFGIAMATQPTFTWSKGAGIGTVNSSSGIYTSPGISGAATIVATSGSITGSASITVTNAAPTVATAAAATPSPANGTSTTLSVLGADDAGEANLTYTWAATSKPAGSNPVFSANGSNSAKTSTVTFDHAGDYTFAVTISDGQGGTVTSSVSETVDQTLTSIGVNPPSATINEDTTQGFTATGYDQFGIAMATQPTFTWSRSAGIGTVNSSSGIYTSPGISGAATIVATSGSITGSASITVTNAAPTVATAAAATPSPANGTTTALSVLGADDGGEANLTYTWAATSKPAGSNPIFSASGTNSAKTSTVTFDQAGDYTFAVTISDGQGGTVTSSVSLTVDQTLTSIAVNPLSATINEDSTQGLTAIGYDQFGIAMATQPTFTWSKSAGIGTVNSGSGIYTSPGISGAATIVATSESITGSASITITNAAPTVAIAAAATPSPVNGTPTTLSVLGADDGGEANLTYTWAATSKPAGSNPIFSANGSNSSKTSAVTFDQAGDYTFAATISDGQGGSAIASVNVVVQQTLSRIMISPGSITIPLNGQAQLNAVAFDQFGALMSVQPPFSWTTDSTVGRIDADTGIYFAGPVSGGATVFVSAGGVSGHATLGSLPVGANQTPMVTSSEIAPRTFSSTPLTIPAWLKSTGTESSTPPLPADFPAKAANVPWVAPGTWAANALANWLDQFVPPTSATSDTNVSFEQKDSHLAAIDGAQSDSHERTLENPKPQGADPNVVVQGAPEPERNDDATPRNMPALPDIAKSAGAKSAPAFSRVKLTSLMSRIIKSSTAGALAIGSSGLIGFVLPAIRSRRKKSGAPANAPANAWQRRVRFRQGRRAR